MHFGVRVPTHQSGILHKVGDDSGDSDDAESGDADARDDEGEHGGGAAAGIKLGHIISKFTSECLLLGGSSL